MLTLLFTFLLMVIRLDGRRKRKLASKIPGSDGHFLFGQLGMALKGPEKVIPALLEIYRK